MSTWMFDHQDARTARALAALAGFVVVATAVVALVVTNLDNPSGTARALLALLVTVSLVLLFYATHRAHHAGLAWEWQHQRTYRAVCARKGLTTKNDDGGVNYPRLRQLVGNDRAWSAVIVPLRGQSLTDWEKSAEAFSLAYGSVGVRFSDNGDGTLTVKAGYMPLESAAPVVREGLPANDGRTWRDRLGAIPVAITEGGNTFTVPAIDTHVLVVGESGAGKGSVVWSLLINLAPAIRAGVVRVWALDPKRVELSIGKGFFYRYASGTEEMVTMMQELVDDMMTRADSLAGQTRKFDPSPEHPLNLIIIDELAYLSSMLPDKKLSAEASKALQTLLVLGRATGYMVVGAAQDPRVETLRFRDLFPTRIGLRMKSGMVDLALGSGSRAAGALCDMIPDPRNGGAGVAYVMGESSHIPQLVRMTWCSDELIKQTSATLLPPPDTLPQIA